MTGLPVGSLLLDAYKESLLNNKILVEVLLGITLLLDSGEIDPVTAEKLDAIISSSYQMRNDKQSKLNNFIITWKGKLN